MDAILIAIFSFIVGAATYTVISYITKYLKSPTVPFNIVYIMSALLSMILVIALSTAFLIPGILPFGAAGLSGDIFVAFACFSMGLAANFLLNLPLTFLLKQLSTSNNSKGVAPDLSDHARKILSVLAIVVLISMLLGTSVYAVVQFNESINNVGRITSYGMNIFSEQELINIVEEIDWRLVDPGETKTITLYMQSTSDKDLTLSMYTIEWDPPLGRDFLTLTWDLPAGTILSPNEVLPFTLILEADPETTGLTAFSFTIVISGTTLDGQYPPTAR